MDYISHSVNSKIRSQKSFTLKPEEASFLDLFCIIFSGELQSKEFIECIQVIKEELLERRGAIFLTVLVHKALQFIANPLSRFGLCFEKCLNLLSSNTNVCLLLVNLLQKKVALPDKESANFLSIVGTLDKSVDLDKNIKPGDNSYFVALSAMASKIAYENKAFIKATVEERWMMELLGAYDFWNEYQQKNTTQAFILRDKTSESDTIIVAFRGTEPFDADAWCTDFDISWYNFQGVGRVHSGFMKALGLQKDESWPQQIQHNYINDHQLAYYAIREKLKGFFEKNSQAKFILTGHSLGGALAVLFPAILVMHNEKSILERLKAVYTFGQPKVGDDKFGQFMQGKFEECEVKYYRFVYSHDIVARMPYDNSTAAFEHFGKCIYLDNLYQAQIIISGDIEEKYSSVVSFFTKRVDAIWELIRSFIMPYIFGGNYRENLQLRLVRVFGILFPGLCDHGPQDYVYATRLGKLSYDSYL